ncbi:MAG TPA: BatD family protein [Lacibacter sp.]|nr:BatD family protein [Lacibacter sp.]HMO88606.1 BatD family protein [Lacibacter sp.]HMP85964.1 BatD family protein [Lacibacter sp.]
MLLLLLAVPAATKAQFRLLVQPSKTILQKNEILYLQFTAEGSSPAEDFRPPAFRDFEQLGEMVQTSGTMMRNGEAVPYVNFSYQLRPRRTGKLQVASATVRLKGRLIISNPLIIQVNEPPASSLGNAPQERLREQPDYLLAPGEDPAQKIRKNLFVKVVVDKQRCFAGEPLVATFKLYTRLDSESKISKRPSFNGFSVTDLEEPERPVFTQEQLEGKTYQVYLIRKVQLIPLQSGDITIEPVEVENRVRFIRTGASYQSGTTNEWLEAVLEQIKNAEIRAEHIVEQQIVLATPPLTISVQELPDAGGLFTGTVGLFTLQAKLQQAVWKAGENGLLRIRVQGSGNLDLLPLPDISWPAGVEVFEPRMQQEWNTASLPVTGEKLFEVTFQSAPGRFTIPAITCLTFNYATKRYDTLVTGPLEWEVLPSAAAASAPNQQQETSVVKDAGDPLKKFFLPAGACLLAAGVVWLLFRFRRKQRATATPVLDAAHEAADDPAAWLQEARLLARNPADKQWIANLLLGFRRYFSTRLKLRPGEPVHSEITAALHRHRALFLAGRYDQWAQAGERALYTPGNKGDSYLYLLDEADALFRDAEAVFNPGSQSGSPRHGQNENR